MKRDPQRCTGGVRGDGVSVVDVLHGLIDSVASAPDAPGGPGGTGPQEAVPPLVTGPTGPDESEDPDDGLEPFDPNRIHEKGKMRPPTLKDLWDTWRKSDGTETFRQGRDIQTKPRDQQTADEAIVTEATSPHAKSKEDFIWEALLEYVPGAGTIWTMTETATNATKAGYEASKAADAADAHEQRAREVIETDWVGDPRSQDSGDD